MESNQTILNLIPDHFRPLHLLEEKLIQAATSGQEVSGFEPGKSLEMAQIGEAQSVRSELLAWLIAHPGARQFIHHKGINLHGARLLGSLDLQDSTVEYPFRLVNCMIEEEMIFDRGKFHLLDFSGSQTGPISADSIYVRYDLLMSDGFTARGEVRIYEANIGADLDCSDGKFENPGGYALNGDRLTIRGAVYLTGSFKAKGEVRFPGANIGGDLACSGGEFENPGGRALSNDGLTMQGDAIMKDGFRAKGEVRFLGAKIGGDLDCIEGEFENPNGIAFSGDRLAIQGSAFLSDSFKASGEVRFVVAKIGGNLVCSGGEFDNPGGDALSGDGLTVQGAVFLSDGFKAKGVVRLVGTNISGGLDCTGGEFENPAGNALSFDSLTTQGDVFLSNGFKARGEVSLAGAHISRNLECDGGEFENPDGIAIGADGLTTQGSAFFRYGFNANGKVRLNGANIGRSLDCANAVFEAGFNGKNMKVGGDFFWQDLAKKPKGELDLENANIGYLNDDEESWPEPGGLIIDGLVYGPFSSGVPADAKSRLAWLKLQNPKNPNVQPYEQLISVFRQMGLRDDAREVAIARQKAIRSRLRGISKFWSWILDITIDYGYRPEKVILWFILPLILLGSFVFYQAFRTGIIEPVAIQENLSNQDPLFDPLAYSLDVFLPIVDLHQESAWESNRTVMYGVIFQYYMYFHILAGWFFTTLAVAAVTGLVRSE